MEDESCGMEGREDDVVTIGRFNRYISFALRHHIAPLKDQVNKIAEYTDQEKLDHAYIKGMVRAILWAVPIANVMMLFVLYLMHKAGIF